MTITKTLLLQVFMLLAFIGSVQGKADQPVFSAKLAGQTQTGTVENDDCAKALELKCSKTPPSSTDYLAFEKDGKTDKDGYSQKSGGITKDILVGGLNAEHYGSWRCIAAKTPLGDEKSDPSAETLKVHCTGCKMSMACTDNPAIGKHSECKDEKCACKYGGTFGKCTECNATHAGCDATSDTPRCVAGKCDKCDQTTKVPCKPSEQCKDDGKCHSTRTVCVPGSCKDDETCVKGLCRKKSSAGTVTSTACLVIASVVVALMN